MTRRPNDFLAERVVLSYEHPAITADGTYKLFKARRKFLVESIQYVNDTGLAADAANFFDIRVEQGAVLIGNWSTETGEEGALVAATFVDLVLSATSADLILESGEELEVFFDETGTQTLPVGRFHIEGRYI